MRLVLGAILAFFGCNAPKEVATVPASARLLGAADGRVYWAEDAVVRWVDPGLKEPVSFNLIGGDWATRANFAAGSRRFHFSHHNKLGSFRVTGGPAARDIDLLDATVPAEAHPSGAVVDGDCVYLAEGDVDCHGRGAIFGLPICGRGRSRLSASRGARERAAAPRVSIGRAVLLLDPGIGAASASRRRAVTSSRFRGREVLRSSSALARGSCGHKTSGSATAASTGDRTKGFATWRRRLSGRR